MVLSTSVVSPCVTSATFLSSCRATSRTSRGKDPNNWATGTIRNCRTVPCNSVTRRSMASRSRWIDLATSLPPRSCSTCLAEYDRAFLATTSSPAKLTRASIFASLTRSTRSVGLSEADRGIGSGHPRRRPSLRGWRRQQVPFQARTTMVRHRAAPAPERRRAVRYPPNAAAGRDARRFPPRVPPRQRNRRNRPFDPARAAIRIAPR